MQPPKAVRCPCHCTVPSAELALAFPGVVCADYKALKDLIKESAAEEATAGVQSFSPRTTSLTVQRATDKRDSGALPLLLGCWPDARLVAVSMVSPAHRV